MTDLPTPACGPLLACDALVGAPRAPLPDCTPDVADLLAEMSRLQITAAVVRHRACLEVAPTFGNRVLMDDIAGHESLLPAWFLTPEGAEPAWDPAAAVAEMLAAGGRMAWTDPTAENFSLRPWCSGPLYAALQERRVPLLLECGTFAYDELHEALTAYPDLRVILLQVPRMGRNRLVEPLLTAHPQLYVCFAPAFSVHCGYADLCARFGPDRWVWGTHYPVAEGGAAVTGLLYAGLDQTALQAIAHGTLQRLLAEVIL